MCLCLLSPTGQLSLTVSDVLFSIIGWLHVHMLVSESGMGWNDNGLSSNGPTSAEQIRRCK